MVNYEEFARALAELKATVEAAMERTEREVNNYEPLQGEGL